MNELIQHAAAMLELDEKATRFVRTDPRLLEPAQRKIANESLVNQAWGMITQRAQAAELDPRNFLDAVGDGGDLVFRSTSDVTLDKIEVPALFTFMGYWQFFRQ